MSALRCYLVDDEELSLSALERMLRHSGRVEIAGSSTDSALAIGEIQNLHPDALFLDIHMPGIDGFQLLSALPQPPLVVFTTAYDHYAVRAFQVNSVDYLLKPIAPERLLDAVSRLERQLLMHRTNSWPIERVLSAVADAVKPRAWLQRVGTQSGENIALLDVDQVTHFVSEDRYVYACTERGRFLVTGSLSDLETRLDPAHFLRIHRSTIVNLRSIDQVSRWFAGRILVRLRNRERTELPVSRDKVRQLREALGLHCA